MLDTDVIQDEVSAIGVASAQPGWRSPIQLARGLAPTPRPWLLLLITGVAFGPYGLGILSNTVLNVLDPAVSAALATLGAFVGMEVDIRRMRGGSSLVAGSVEAFATLVTVAGGMLAVHALSDSSVASPWLFAGLLGICAASSATPPPSPAREITGLGGSGDLVPIVIGLPILAAMRSQTPEEILDLDVWIHRRCARGRGRLLVAGLAHLVGHRGARVRDWRFAAAWRRRCLSLAVVAIRRLCCRCRLACRRHRSARPDRPGSRLPSTAGCRTAVAGGGGKTSRRRSRLQDSFRCMSSVGSPASSRAGCSLVALSNPVNRRISLCSRRASLAWLWH